MAGVGANIKKRFSKWIDSLVGSMSKVTVNEAAKKKIKAIYLTHGENSLEVRHFVEHLNNICLEMLESMCSQLMPFLRWFLESKKETTHL